MLGGPTSGESTTVRVGIHPDPVWRERANFIIAAPIEEGGDTTTEQLWSKRIADHRFQICCIPFWVYDLALGDLVETDEAYLVKRVVEWSGRFPFRIWFGESFHPRGEIAEELHAMGALLEWSSTNLLAVDAADDPLAQRIADVLHGHEQRGRLRYETGLSAPH